jgi:hypothetical protein
MVVVGCHCHNSPFGFVPYEKRGTNSSPIPHVQSTGTHIQGKETTDTTASTNIFREIIMIIKDKNGREFEVETVYVFGLNLVSFIESTRMPIASTTILETGELCNEIRLPEFQGNKELTNYRILKLQEAIRLNHFIPISGKIYGVVDLENKASLKYWEKMGAHSDTVEINGKQWQRFWNTVDEEIRGVVRIA